MADVFFFFILSLSRHCKTSKLLRKVEPKYNSTIIVFNKYTGLLWMANKGDSLRSMLVVTVLKNVPIEISQFFYAQFLKTPNRLSKSKLISKKLFSFCYFSNSVAVRVY